MKIFLIGSRGIPARYGGFETFAEELSIRLVQKGFDVTVVCQKQEEQLSEYQGVKLFYSNYSKAKNPVRFYRDSLKKIDKESGIVIVCGVGGAIFYPMMKKKNQRLITHVDGREELRGKYSALKKMYVRICQRFALQGDHLIADSHAIENHWKKKYPYSQNKISTIEYGANRSDAIDLSPLEKLRLSKDVYYLVVCRMVPENNLAMIVDGFKISGSGKKLVLVGATDNSTGLQMKKHESESVIFPGSIYDKKLLAALRSGCFAYIHGHSVGGTNPSLLESMAVGSICICHDNPYNRETMLNERFYFHSAEELAGCIRRAEHSDVKILDGIKEAGRKRIQDRYNWDGITNEYCKLFESLTKDGR